MYHGRTLVTTALAHPGTECEAPLLCGRARKRLPKFGINTMAQLYASELRWEHGRPRIYNPEDEVVDHVGPATIIYFNDKLRLGWDIEWGWV